MKNILMSIRPQWVAKILNGEKTIEVRKKFPKDYVGWVYIYCTKDRNKTLSYQVIPHDRKVIKGYNGFNDKDFDFQFIYLTKIDINNGWGWFAREHNLNGKVIARFWCDKVEEINFHVSYNEDIRGYRLNNIYSTEKDLLKKSCLTQHELYSYLPRISPCGYAIHITKLEIFDKPMCLNSFYYARNPRKDLGLPKSWKQIVTRPPQSYMFIEV